MDDINETILLANPNIRKFILLRYQLYKLLKLPLDFFYNEDVINYGKNFYSINFNLNMFNNVLILNRLDQYKLLKEKEDIMIYTQLCNMYYIKHANPTPEYGRNILIFIATTLFSKIEFTDKQLAVINYLQSIIDSSPNSINVLEIIQNNWDLLK